MKKYFAKFLPTTEEIKEGDSVEITNLKDYKNNTGERTIAKTATEVLLRNIKASNNSEKYPNWMNPKKVKLFLCSRDIQVGDEIRAMWKFNDGSLSDQWGIVTGDGADNEIIQFPNYWNVKIPTKIEKRVYGPGNNGLWGRATGEMTEFFYVKVLPKEHSFKVIGEIPWVENFEQEEWSDVEGYEGLYLISSFGRLYSLPRNRWNGRGYQKIGGHMLTFGEQKDGYPKVTLCKNGKCKAVRPYRLVAKAFIPNPENLPDVNHKDNNPKNCHISNLEWTNQQRNIAYTVAQGRQIKGERVNHSKLTKDEVLTIRDRIRRKECSQHQIAKEFKVSQGVISDIINRKSWRHV